MPTEVKAPTTGESVSEIYIGQWHKSVGEHVEQDEPLVELESDKATLDLPAPVSGVLQKILKEPGDTAEVGETLAIIDESGKAPRKSADRASQRSEEEEETEPEPEEAEAGLPEAEPVDEEEPEPEPAPSRPRPARVKQEPAARHDAEAARRGDRALRAPDDQQRGAPPAQDRRRPAKSPERDEAASPWQVPVGSKDGDERGEDRVPMSALRRQIADRLVRAQQTAALLTTFNEVDLTAVKQLRAELGDRFERKHGVRLGFMSFFVKAAVEALCECPELNAFIDDDEIVYRRYYDIGVAVSTERGLVVPVLRDADQMSFADIERAVEDLANRARERSLRVEELQGGTFTITNGGVFGSLLSTPIVNPPQSGVLGMHAIQDRPVVRDGAVVVRPMMYLALTYDHRLVDGREAVMFLRRIKETIEAPARLALGV